MPRQTLYRYRCSCGHKGRGYVDGNLATMYGEQHVTSDKISGYHSWTLQERQPDGTWRSQ